MEKRYTEDANRDIEAAQGEAEHEQKTTGKMQREKERMLVMGKVSKYLVFHDWPRVVSGTAKQRDDLRDVVRDNLDDGIELMELEYQPKEG